MMNPSRAIALAILCCTEVERFIVLLSSHARKPRSAAHSSCATVSLPAARANIPQWGAYFSRNGLVVAAFAVAARSLAAVAAAGSAAAAIAEERKVRRSMSLLYLLRLRFRE